MGEPFQTLRVIRALPVVGARTAAGELPRPPRMHALERRSPPGHTAPSEGDLEHCEEVPFPLHFPSLSLRTRYVAGKAAGGWRAQRLCDAEQRSGAGSGRLRPKSDVSEALYSGPSRRTCPAQRAAQGSRPYPADRRSEAEHATRLRLWSRRPTERMTTTDGTCSDQRSQYFRQSPVCSNAWAAR